MASDACAVALGQANFFVRGPIEGRLLTVHRDGVDPEDDDILPPHATREFRTGLEHLDGLSWVDAKRMCIGVAGARDAEEAMAVRDHLLGHEHAARLRYRYPTSGVTMGPGVYRERWPRQSLQGGGGWIPAVFQWRVRVTAYDNPHIVILAMCESSDVRCSRLAVLVSQCGTALQAIWSVKPKDRIYYNHPPGLRVPLDHPNMQSLEGHPMMMLRNRIVVVTGVQIPEEADAVVYNFCETVKTRGCFGLPVRDY